MMERSPRTANRSEATQLAATMAAARRQFPSCRIRRAWVQRFLQRFVSADEDPIEVMRQRELRARWLYDVLVGGGLEDEGELASLVFRDSLELPSTSLAAKPRVASNLARALARLVADRPPATPIVFDHVSKTGGSTVIAALSFVFPHHVVSPRVDLQAGATDESRQQLARWPILCGHIGRRNHSHIPDLSRRKLCTVIRDPVSRTRSVYTFFRYNVRPTHPSYGRPALVAARELPFSEFIRDQRVHLRISNQQYRTLSLDSENAPGELTNANAKAEACSLLGVYDLVGVTDRLVAFMDRMLEVMDVNLRLSADELIQFCYRRKSRRTVDISRGDRRYIESLNQLDCALYEEACRRSQPESLRRSAA